MTDWMETTIIEIAEIEMGQSPGGEICNTFDNGISLLNRPTEFGINNPKAGRTKRLSVAPPIIYDKV